MLPACGAAAVAGWAFGDHAPVWGGGANASGCRPGSRWEAADHDSAAGGVLLLPWCYVLVGLCIGVPKLLWVMLAPWAKAIPYPMSRVVYRDAPRVARSPPSKKLYKR